MITYLRIIMAKATKLTKAEEEKKRKHIMPKPRKKLK